MDYKKLFSISEETKKLAKKAVEAQKNFLDKTIDGVFENINFFLKEESWYEKFKSELLNSGFDFDPAIIDSILLFFNETIGLFPKPYFYMTRHGDFIGEFKINGKEISIIITESKIIFWYNMDVKLDLPIRDLYIREKIKEKLKEVENYGQ